MVDRQIHVAVSENVKKKGLLTRNRQEYLRYLTKKGADFLDAHTEWDIATIRYVKRHKERLKNDYFHRVSSVFSTISFDTRCTKIGATDGKKLLYFDNTYKQPSKRKFDAETRLSLGGNSHYSPDMIFSYTDTDGKPYVLCVEVYNGNKVGRVVGQLEKLFTILDTTKKIEQRIGVDAVPRILVTFDNENLQTKVMERVRVNPAFAVEGVEGLLLFGLDTEVWSDF